jgi:hypothetical protein
MVAAAWAPCRKFPQRRPLYPDQLGVKSDDGLQPVLVRLAEGPTFGRAFGYGRLDGRLDGGELGVGTGGAARAADATDLVAPGRWRARGVARAVTAAPRPPWMRRASTMPRTPRDAVRVMSGPPCQPLPRVDQALLLVGLLESIEGSEASLRPALTVPYRRAYRS